MKAFLHRLHIGGGQKEKEKENPLQKEKFPPLPVWPPSEPQRPTSATPSFKPLPEIAPVNRPLPPIDESPISRASSSTITPQLPQLPSHPDQTLSDLTSDPEPSNRNDRKLPNGVPFAAAADVQKKVAFISPPPTPTTTDRILSNDTPATQPPPPPPTTAIAAAAPLLKTNVSRFQATHGEKPRASVSTAASSSKTDVANKTTAKATSTRTASPYLQKQSDAASSASLRSGTPYSQMSQSTTSGIFAAASWSEVTEEDLVSNLGARERTRQEVLFEIISSEDRYVQELIKMKDTFIDPLLHPYSTSAAPLSSTPNLDYEYYRSESPLDSGDYLPPIAARFMSPSPSGPPPSAGASSIRTKETHNIDNESLETDEDDEVDDLHSRGYHGRRAASPISKTDHPRSPYRSAPTKSSKAAVPVPFPSRSHMSLPPPPRNQMSASTHSLGRQSITGDHERERERKYSQGDTSQKTSMLRKFKKSQTSPSAILGDYVAPHQLPEDLRVCLEVVDSGVLDGHKRLSDALKKRYDDQYPLVRSLADVFVSNSDIFQGYAKYVLHLERALEQVDAALQNVSTKKPKKQDAGEWQKVCKLLQKLEESASDKGETGLAITLSKPFQRLLKYPLLFQNLLFHTDPSTFEYESTLQMVAEVETIVRSIEDEKIQKEERDKTRDVFARIEGLDKVRQLALPKPSRVLVEEKPCNTNPTATSPHKTSSPPPVVNAKGVRGKSSFRRLSDVLYSGSSGIGGKKDLWLVVFNDVILQCQRTGTTSLPLVAATTSRTTSLPDLQGKAKYATTGRRNVQTKPRNLYKFIKIETWAIGDVMQPREGVVSMEDVVRSRAQAHAQPKIVPLPADNEDDGDSDDSDRKSKMSFSYWGADKITVQKPLVKPRGVVSPRRGGAAASYNRESSANAKFGSRLVSNDSPSPRPASRRNQAATPTPRRPAPMDDGPNYAKATVTRPAWGAGAGSPVPLPSKRSRNTSQTSAATRVAIPSKAVGSPAPSENPSEDSGVGLYRQMLAQDPSLNST